MNARTTSQSEINFPRLTAKQKLELDIKAAMWCFMGNHAFTMFENPFGKSFLQSLNPAYIPPSRHAISGRLLDAVYSQVRTQTDELIASLPHINVITDESTNINKAKICNISIHSEHGSIHYLSEDILAKRMTASAAAEWLRNHLLTLSNGDLSRLNSLGTDTCKVMLNMCLQLQQYDDLKHCFFIPCDSHGIQLLIKDLLQIPRFQEVLKQAQTVVKAFRKAPLQYARLRTLQMHFYKRHQSLILSVITRWGTQFRLIRSVINNKDALKRYAFDYGDLAASQRIKDPALVIIRSSNFWAGLESIRELLQHLDEALRMSESGKSHLGHVLSRWLGILDNLNAKKAEFPNELSTFLLPKDGTFGQRYQRQVKAIHVTAYYLLPENRTKNLPANFEGQIQTFLRQYTSTQADYQTISYEFESFRAQESPFEYGRRCWDLSEHPKLFWHAAMSHTKLLGKLAYRIFAAPVNSVASERAFSTQNLIHTTSRNALHSERTNKLVYLYTNGRILNQFEKIKLELIRDLKSKPIRDMTDEDEVALEDILLGSEAEAETSTVITDSEENEIDDEEDDDEDSESEVDEDEF